MSARLILLFADLLIVSGCFAAGYVLRVDLLSRFSALQTRGAPIALEAYLLFVLIYLAVFAYSGLYHRRVSSLEESVIVLRACFYATACALALSSLAHVSHLYSRAVIAISAGITAIVAPAGRLAVKSLLARWRAWQKPVLLLGLNPQGLRAALDMAGDSTTGYRIIGVLTDRPPPDCPLPVWQAPDYESAIRFAREQGVKSFILCEEQGNGSQLLDNFRHLEEFADEIKIAAADESLHASRMHSEVLRSSYLLSWDNPLSKAPLRVLKRAFDVLFGGMLAIAFLPALIVLPLLIRLTSRGPVLFRQARLGQGGAEFTCLKFRTMRAGAESELERLRGQDQGLSREFSRAHKLRNDPRVTSVGAWLRRTSLDELPQLWNVLRGDMSLVGPRPIVREETEKYNVELSNYFRVPPGMTGLWQISGRNDLSYEERVRLDLFYIRNWSIWLDLIILAKTALHVLRPRGAY